MTIIIIVSLVTCRVFGPKYCAFTYSMTKYVIFVDSRNYEMHKSIEYNTFIKLKDLQKKDYEGN